MATLTLQQRRRLPLKSSSQQTQNRTRNLGRSTLESDILAAALSEDDEAEPCAGRPNHRSKQRRVVDSESDDDGALSNKENSFLKTRALKSVDSGEDDSNEESLNDTNEEASSDEESASSSSTATSSGNHKNPAQKRTIEQTKEATASDESLSDGSDGSETSHDSSSHNVTDESEYEPGQDEGVHWSNQHDADDESSLESPAVKRKGFRAKIAAATQKTFSDDESNDDDDLDPSLVIDDQDELRFARSSAPDPLDGSVQVDDSTCPDTPNDTTPNQPGHSSSQRTDATPTSEDFNDNVSALDDNLDSTLLVEETDELHFATRLSNHSSPSFSASGNDEGVTVAECPDATMDGEDTIEDSHSIAIEQGQLCVVEPSQEDQARHEARSSITEAIVVAVDDDESECGSFDEVVGEIIDTGTEGDANGVPEAPDTPCRTHENISPVVQSSDESTSRRPPTEITVSNAAVAMSPMECYRSQGLPHKSRPAEDNECACNEAHDGNDMDEENTASTERHTEHSVVESNNRTVFPAADCKEDVTEMSESNGKCHIPGSVERKQLFKEPSKGLPDSLESIKAIEASNGLLDKVEPSRRNENSGQVRFEESVLQSPVPCVPTTGTASMNSSRRTTMNALSNGTLAMSEALEISVLCKSIGTMSLDQGRSSRTLTVNPTSDTTLLSKDATALHPAVGSTNKGNTNQRSQQSAKPIVRRYRREGTIKRGKWKLGAKIGSGAFGVVHVGMNIETGAFIAVKSLKMEPSVMKDAEREVDLLKSLRHENIVRYLGAEMDSKCLHIFQEWVPGGSVDCMLSKFGPFPLVVYRNYLEQILRGIQYLHESNIMHRDIKGSNILVSDEGIVKLADFGAGKRFQQLKCDMMMSLTMRGTPYFMAPEVFQEKYSTKADIWSVACVAVQMATGTPPWKKLGFTNPVSLYQHMTSTTHVPGIEFDGSIGPLDGCQQMLLFTNLLESCFQRQPESRPSALTLLADVFFSTDGDTLDDDNSEYRGLFSPDSRGSMCGTSPIRGSLSPLRPPMRRRNSIASSPLQRCFSPPLPRSTKKRVVQSPSGSPRRDATDWPTWAQQQLRRIEDYPSIPENAATGAENGTSSKSTIAKDSLAYSEDSSDRQLGSDTSLAGLKLVETYVQSSP